MDEAAVAVGVVEVVRVDGPVAGHRTVDSRAAVDKVGTTATPLAGPSIGSAGPACGYGLGFGPAPAPGVAPVDGPGVGPAIVPGPVFVLGPAAVGKGSKGIRWGLAL